MKMKKTLLLAALLVAGFLSAHAQQVVRFNPEYSSRDIRIDAGLLLLMENEGWDATLVQAHYTQNFLGPLAYRAGIQAFQLSGESGFNIGVPLAIAYRPGVRSLGSSLVSAAEMSVFDAVWYGASGRADAIGTSILANFLTAIFRRSEYFAGFTPGIDHTGRFSLTADLGFVLSIPIRRVGINITPAYHHVLTGNYDLADTRRRSLFSITAGISYLF